MTRKLKDILRCYASGMSIRSISAVFEISRNTVRRYVRQFQESGLTHFICNDRGEIIMFCLTGANVDDWDPRVWAVLGKKI